MYITFRGFNFWFFFQISSVFQCVDVNECTLPNACGAGSLCTNFPGGHLCECPEGYTGDAYGSGCRDIDECSGSPCGKDAVCSNNEGSFRCSCPPGFAGDPLSSCKGTSRTPQWLRWSAVHTAGTICIIRRRRTARHNRPR